MRGRFLIFLFVAAGFACVPSASAAGPGLIVKFSSDITRVEAHGALPGIEALQGRFGHAGLQRLYRPPRSFRRDAVPWGLDRVFRVRCNSEQDLIQALDAYASLDCFEYVEVDGFCALHALDTIRPNDRFLYRQWGLHNDGTFVFEGLDIYEEDADIDMPEAWKYTQGESSVIVAIIDSGCKKNHPELAGRFWTNTDEIPDNGIDDDGNEYVDDTWGWNFIDGDNAPDDLVGHGTAVAGFVAATGMNGIGFAGMDWNCKLMILKVVADAPDGDQGAAFGDMFEAIMYAADNGADIINISLGGESRSTAVEQAINYAVSKQCVVVASAGNDNKSPVSFPARYSKVIAVGSTDPDDTRTVSFLYKDPESGSNYGTALDVVAPGNFCYFLLHDNDTAFDHASGGTSFSAPHVTGLAALLRGQDSTRTASEIREIIEQTCDDQVGDPSEDVAGWDQYYGHGRINAFRAVTYGVTLVNNARQSRPRSPARAWVESGVLHVAFRDAALAGPAEIRMYDMHGRRVLRTQAVFLEGSSTVRLTCPAKGRYVFSVNLQSGESRGTLLNLF